MMIVVMELMNHQNTANLKDERALAISSLATTEIAFREFTFAVSVMLRRTEHFNLNFFLS